MSLVMAGTFLASVVGGCGPEPAPTHHHPFEISFVDPSGQPVAGVMVSLDGRPLGVTQTAGRIEGVIVGAVDSVFELSVAPPSSHRLREVSALSHRLQLGELPSAPGERNPLPVAEVITLEPLAREMLLDIHIDCPPALVEACRATTISIDGATPIEDELLLGSDLRYRGRLQGSAGRPVALRFTPPAGLSVDRPQTTFVPQTGGHVLVVRPTVHASPGQAETMVEAAAAGQAAPVRPSNAASAVDPPVGSLPRQASTTARQTAQRPLKTPSAGVDGQRTTSEGVAAKRADRRWSHRTNAGMKHEQSVNGNALDELPPEEAPRIAPLVTETNAPTRPGMLPTVAPVAGGLPPRDPSMPPPPSPAASTPEAAQPSIRTCTAELDRSGRLGSSCRVWLESRPMSPRRTFSESRGLLARDASTRAAWAEVETWMDSVIEAPFADPHPEWTFTRGQARLKRGRLTGAITDLEAAWNGRDKWNDERQAERALDVLDCLAAAYERRTAMRSREDDRERAVELLEDLIEGAMRGNNKTLLTSGRTRLAKLTEGR